MLKVTLEGCYEVVPGFDEVIGIFMRALSLLIISL